MKERLLPFKISLCLDFHHLLNQVMSAPYINEKRNIAMENFLHLQKKVVKLRYNSGALFLQTIL